MMKPINYIFGSCIDLGKQFRREYLPPLVIYFSSGLLALTSIAGAFFTKDYLNLSAAFLVELTFWASLPWILKVAFGHLADLFWKQKDIIIYVGASLVSIDLLIMFGLIQHTSDMSNVMSIEAWYIAGTLLTSVGYLLQDVVADAMTVEAVPTVDDEGKNIDEHIIKERHVTLQSLSQFVLIGAAALVSFVNMTVFNGGDAFSEAQRNQLYADMYLYTLLSPLMSVCGIFLAKYLSCKRARDFSAKGPSYKRSSTPPKKTDVNWKILFASFLLIAFSILLTSFGIPFSQEILFFGLASLIFFLMSRVLKSLPERQRLTVIGIAILIFVSGATPHTGPPPSWFEIDKLLFDEQFFSILFLLTTTMALLGIILLRPFVINNSIAKIVAILTVVSTLLSLPSIGMYYGLHNWTSSITGGVVDARFIAIANTAVASPFGHVVMVPLFAWVAQNAPSDAKATFFALFASFVSLSGLASSLGTKYLNQVFVVTREVKDKLTGQILMNADYSELGLLMITAVVIAFIVKIGTVVAVQNSRFCIKAGAG